LRKLSDINRSPHFHPSKPGKATTGHVETEGSRNMAQTSGSHGGNPLSSTMRTQISMNTLNGPERQLNKNSMFQDTMKKEDYNSDDTEKQEDILDQQNNTL